MEWRSSSISSELVKDPSDWWSCLSRCVRIQFSTLNLQLLLARGVSMLCPSIYEAHGLVEADGWTSPLHTPRKLDNVQFNLLQLVFGALVVYAIHGLLEELGVLVDLSLAFSYELLVYLEPRVGVCRPMWFLVPVWHISFDELEP